MILTDARPIIWCFLLNKIVHIFFCIVNIFLWFINIGKIEYGSLLFKLKYRGFGFSGKFIIWIFSFRLNHKQNDRQHKKIKRQRK